ncbi:MAG TPA: amidase [Candidatus Polarisedimenticolia bacterium]|nr:amidase [Candidatus Polarisedimenticolia bacterium]
MLEPGVLFASARDLGERIRSRKISPVELAEAYLEKLEGPGRKLGAVVTVTRELALEQARRAEKELRAGKIRSKLHGVPYGAKDLLATNGIPTTWGATPYKDQVFTYDATVIDRLEKAGAVLLGKLAMVELAGGMGYRYASASLTGAGKNPWNPARWSGGSSSGSGVAVAGGMVGFAIGTETWGSITTPSSMCGISGIRPTYGRVSRHGAMALSWTMDKIGVMARAVDDCGLVLSHIAGPDKADATTIPSSWSYAPPARKGKWRIGVVRKAWEKTEPEVPGAFDAALRELGALATLQDVTLPDLPFGATAGTLIVAEVASAFEDLIESGRVAELADPGSRLGGYSSTMVAARDYLRALRLRARLQRALDEVLSKFDALVAPTLPGVASPLEANLEEVFAGDDPVGGAGNCCGVPAVSVPMGFGAGHLPLGIQFVGRAGEENRLLGIAKDYQSRTPWHRELPPREALH